MNCPKCPKCPKCKKPRDAVKNDRFNSCNAIISNMMGNSDLTREMTRYLKDIGWFWDFCTEFGTRKMRRFIYNLKHQRNKENLCPTPTPAVVEPVKCEICDYNIHSCGIVCQNYDWPHMYLPHNDDD